MTQTLVKPFEDKAEDLQPSVELEIKDRCDRCGARAYYRCSSKASGAELLFCGHHGRKHKANLESKGFTIDDQTQKLYANTKPMSGSNLAD